MADLIQSDTIQVDKGGMRQPWWLLCTHVVYIAGCGVFFYLSMIQHPKFSIVSDKHKSRTIKHHKLRQYQAREGVGTISTI